MHKITVVMQVQNERAKMALERVKSVASLYSDNYSVQHEYLTERKRKGDKK